MLRDYGLKVRPWTVRGLMAVSACTWALACGEEFRTAASAGGSGGADASVSMSPAGGEGPAGGADGTTGGAGEGAMPSGGQAGMPPLGGGAGGAAAGAAGIGVGGLGAAGGNVSILPISDARLELWLSAERGVRVDSASVAGWTDASPHQRNANQTAANYRPKLGKDDGTGKPIVLFDGQDDWMSFDDIDADFSKGVSLFMVVRASQPGTCQAYFELSNGSEVDDLHFGDYRGSLLYEVSSPFLNDLMYAAHFDEPILAVAVHEPDGTASIRQNGNGAGQLEDLPLPAVVTRSENYLGRTLYDGCSPMKGGISELVLFSRAVTDDELVAMEAHLREKWACCSSD